MQNFDGKIEKLKHDGKDGNLVREKRDCGWCGCGSGPDYLCEECRQMHRYAQVAKDRVLQITGGVPVGFQSGAVCLNCGPTRFINGGNDGCEDCKARYLALVICGQRQSLKDLAEQASLFPNVLSAFMRSKP